MFAVVNKCAMFTSVTPSMEGAVLSSVVMKFLAIAVRNVGMNLK